jgi:hypothetical protein
VLADDLSRQKRAAERAKVMVIRKGRLGQPEMDLTPVRGVDAISLTTRLTIESFSLAGIGSAAVSRESVQVCFVPRNRE